MNLFDRAMQHGEALAASKYLSKRVVELTSQLAERDREIEKLKKQGRVLVAANTGHFDSAREATVALTRLREDGERAQSLFFYDMAKWAAQKWEDEVRHRPSQNYLKAGLDSAWKGLEAYCLKRREDIDAARGEGE